MIILRKENFGGIAFNTENANQLWLDQELFLAVKKNEKNEQVKEVFEKLQAKDFSIKLVAAPPTANNFPFVVLSAPVLADIHITTRCNLRCPHCYVNSSNQGFDMGTADFLRIADQCQKAGVMQIALGGGEPTLHPCLGKYLKIIRQKGIVPNLTTNGKFISLKNLYYFSRYAGAVALSIEELGSEFEKRRNFPFSDFVKSAKKLKAAKIRLVFQVTISKKNLPRINNTINYLLKFKPYGILFLAYKPQGRGRHFDAPIALAPKEEVSKTLKKIFSDLRGKTRVGFDCCITPALMEFENNSEFKGCSAARESAAIMADLRVLPCSFLDDDGQWDDLKNKSMMDIWRGEKFNKFRERILDKSRQNICQQCHQKNICLGGCPQFDLVRCGRI